MKLKVKFPIDKYARDENRHYLLFSDLMRFGNDVICVRIVSPLSQWLSHMSIEESITKSTVIMLLFRTTIHHSRAPIVKATVEIWEDWAPACESPRRFSNLQFPSRLAKIYSETNRVSMFFKSNLWVSWSRYMLAASWMYLPRADGGGSPEHGTHEL